MPTFKLIKGSLLKDLLIGTDGQDDIYGFGGDDTILGGNGYDYIHGGDGNDSINGQEGRGVISGEDGRDTIYGGTSADQLVGGDDNDLIFGGAGDDVLAGDDYLSDNSSSGSDTLYGGAGNDYLYGGDGSDKLFGGIGNDTFSGGDGDDSLYGDSGDDSLQGGAGKNLLNGGEGNDTLISYDTIAFFFSPTDTLIGGTGNDVYELKGSISTQDAKVATIVENTNEGVDLIKMTTQYFDDIVTYTMAANVENIELTRGAEEIGFVNHEAFAFDDPNLAHVIGNGLNNTMWGTDWADVLDGGAGNDLIFGGGSVRGIDGNAEDSLLGGTGNDKIYGSVNADWMEGGDGDDMIVGGKGDWLIGGLGNDTYVVLGGKPQQIYDWDTVGGGVDSVETDLTSFTLDVGLENLKFINNLNSVGNGNAAWNKITGGAGSDTLKGFGGDDILKGGAGNDSIDGGTGNDVLEGNDGLNSLIGGTGNDSMYGGSSRDFLQGDDGNDKMYGGFDADYLTGGKGFDSLAGGDGNDTLTGGLGADTLNGGLGADTFVFLSADDAKAGFIIERIDGFTKGQDKISMFAIDPVKSDTTTHHFQFTGSSHFFFSEGTIWTEEANGSTYVYADIDGGGAEMMILLTGVTGVTANDFIL